MTRPRASASVMRRRRQACSSGMPSRDRTSRFREQGSMVTWPRPWRSGTGVGEEPVQRTLEVAWPRGPAPMRRDADRLDGHGLAAAEPEACEADGYAPRAGRAGAAAVGPSAGSIPKASTRLPGTRPRSSMSCVKEVRPRKRTTGAGQHVGPGAAPPHHESLRHEGVDGVADGHACAFQRRRRAALAGQAVARPGAPR